MGTPIGFLVLFALFSLVPAVSAESAYIQSPDIHGDRIVFAAEGDLWTASSSGEDVRRITSHVGDESRPCFSPDGRRIAFTGYYDGNRDVYVIPTEGGEPQRLTWHPSPDLCRGWTPDGEKVVFLSWRRSPNGSPLAFTVPAGGGEPELIPIDRAYSIDVDPESGRYAFTRTSGGGPRKRYRGGSAEEIWVGDPRKADFRKVTDFDGVDTNPMWAGGRIFYLCDRGGTMNIWSMDPDGSDRTRHTDLREWDARQAAAGPDGRIVFTLAGDIQIFDPSTNRHTPMAIDLPSERVLTRKRYPNPEQYVTWFSLSPDGSRLAVVSRGEIFSVPADEGVLLPVTNGSGARERRPSFDPDGKRLVYITDESREEEIVVADAWGRGEAKRIEKAEKSLWHFPPRFSPEGDRIAYSDQNQDLYVVDVDGGNATKADHCDFGEITDYSWSPDGRWLAYSKNNDIEIGSIFLYDTEENRTHQVTAWTTDDWGPAWDPDGRYLYFLSDRVMNPFIGSRDFETVELEMTKPYMLLLRPDVENPFICKTGVPPEEKDEEAAGGEEENDTEEAGEQSEPDLPPVEIDFDGIAGRWIELPVDAGRYSSLAATKGKVFFVSWPTEGAAEIDFATGLPSPKGTLMAFDWTEKEASTFVSGISGYELASSAEKIAIMKRAGDLYVIGAAALPGDLSQSKVSLSGMLIELDPREEWAQIFYDGWRQMRDFYWDQGMQGVDWEAVRDQYAALLPRIATRDDLDDVLGEMLGELATSHTYLFGGDPGRRVPRVSTGTLGAEVERSGSAFRVTRIYHGDAADRVRSPLEEPGVDVREGEYILSVNGLPFRDGEPFEARLENLAGQDLLLEVNDEPTRDGCRQVVVTAHHYSETQNLIYADWVRRNREAVWEMSGGTVGYVHLPDMDSRGLAEFDRWFYPQLDKQGMVVDMRWNAGGYVSQLIYARLNRHPVFWGRSRGGDVYSWPANILNGPSVVLVNEFSGSDGDLGPSGIQLDGLAPIIGKRTWGGVVGIRADKQLVDGGLETQPEFAPWDHVRGWGLENRGVDPDIEVENLPHDVARGVDAQLQRAVEEVARLREAEPPARPDFGTPPDRSRGTYLRQEK